MRKWRFTQSDCWKYGQLKFRLLFMSLSLWRENMRQSRIRFSCYFIKTYCCVSSKMVIFQQSSKKLNSFRPKLRSSVIGLAKRVQTERFTILRNKKDVIKNWSITQRQLTHDTMCFKIKIKSPLKMDMWSITLIPSAEKVQKCCSIA